MHPGALRGGGGLGQSTSQCAPHIQGLRSPPDKKIASAAIITTRSNRALSRMKSTTEANNSASTRIRLMCFVSGTGHLRRDSCCLFRASCFSTCLVRTLLEEKFTPFFIRSKSTSSPSGLMTVTLVRSMTSLRPPKSRLVFLQVVPSSTAQSPMRVPSTSSVRRDGVSAMDILNMLRLYRT